MRSKMLFGLIGGALALLAGGVVAGAVVLACNMLWVDTTGADFLPAPDPFFQIAPVDDGSLELAPGISNASYISRVFDLAGMPICTLSYNTIITSGLPLTLTLSYRTSMNDPNFQGIPFSYITTAQAGISVTMQIAVNSPARYLQYKADFTTGAAAQSPLLNWVKINYGYDPATPTPEGTATPPPTPQPTVTPCAVSFGDVQPTDYFYGPVTYLACRSIISGYADGTFRPYNTTTRAQLAKIVVTAFPPGIPLPTPANGYTFADVLPAHPFYAVVEEAAARNIVSGYACGGPGEPCDAQRRPYFRPYTPVTRGQLAKLIVTAAGWPPSNPVVGTFADVAPGSAFYGYVQAAAGHGVVSGYACGGAGEPCNQGRQPYFRPYGNATRGQVAKIVYQAIIGPAQGK